MLLSLMLKQFGLDQKDLREYKYIPFIWRANQLLWNL